MKKLMALALVLAMLAALLAGCGAGGETDGNKGETAAQSGNSDDTGEKVKLTIGISQNTLVEDYETNSYIKWLEEQTGYDIEVQLYAASSADANTQLSVALLDESSQLPDMLLDFRGLGATTWRMYGEDGYFVPLTDYFEDRDGVAKPWYDRLEEIGVEEGTIKQILLAASANDGEVYAFPTLEFGSLDNMDYAVHMNQTWLNELNLEMPSDPESLYEVLKAFKAAHPNSYPLVGLKTTQLCGDVISWLLNMFGYSDDTKYLTLSEDGKTVGNNFTSDAYREGLEYCHKLYSEGLLYITTRPELSSLVNVSDEEMSVGCFVGHPSLVLEANNPCIYNYVACPIWGYAVVNENARRYANFITESAIDNGTVDACWNLLMTMCSKESSYRQRYGEYGTDWEWADEGTVSLTGAAAEIKVLNPTAISSVGNNCLKVVCGTILNNCENEATQISDDMGEWEAYRSELQSQQYEYFYAAAKKNPKYIWPSITLTDEERDEINDTVTNCKEFIQQYRLSFVNGEGGIDPSNDNNWNAYVKGLEDAGLSRWIEKYQEVYNERYIDTVIG